MLYICLGYYCDPSTWYYNVVSMFGLGCDPTSLYPNVVKILVLMLWSNFIASQCCTNIRANVVIQLHCITMLYLCLGQCCNPSFTVSQCCTYVWVYVVIQLHCITMLCLSLGQCCNPTIIVSQCCTYVWDRCCDPTTLYYNVVLMLRPKLWSNFIVSQCCTYVRAFVVIQSHCITMLYLYLGKCCDTATLYTNIELMLV